MRSPPQLNRLTFNKEAIVEWPPAWRVMLVARPFHLELWGLGLARDRSNFDEPEEAVRSAL